MNKVVNCWWKTRDCSAGLYVPTGYAQVTPKLFTAALECRGVARTVGVVSWWERRARLVLFGPELDLWWFEVMSSYRRGEHETA